MYTAVREALLERRQGNVNQNVLWDALTPAQRFSANHYSQEGYELAFIRRSQHGDFAVLLQDQQIITVGLHGKINTESHLSFR